MEKTEFPLSAVRVTDEYLQNAIRKETAYLLSLDTERLLAGFRETAGLPTGGVKRYSGWESGLIGGHTMGHYLTALAQAYAADMTTDADHLALEERIHTCIDALWLCQKNAKQALGYIFGACLLGNENVEFQFDHVEQGKTDIFHEAWVPWYTMHKILSGIIDCYELVGYTKAKTLAMGLGDWVDARSSAWDEETRLRVLKTEYGGMNDCLYNLYRITGEERYAVCAHRFDEVNLFERVYQGGKDTLCNLHANTTIPKFIGAVNRYAVLHNKVIQGETADAAKYLAYTEAFFDMVLAHHTYITGGNSDWEHFREDDLLDSKRSNGNCETCNTYNMLKLSRKLYLLTGKKKYMDYYETTYKNAILPSQNPKTGMTTYFQPMGTGYFKVYSTPDLNFWCCTGSGMENFTKLGSCIYSEEQDAIFVDFYLSSVLTFQKGITLEQTYDTLKCDKACFVMHVPQTSSEFSVGFRIPDWLCGDICIFVNGKEEPFIENEGYAIIRKQWRESDSIELLLPAGAKTYGLKEDASVFAIKYGPLVLSADLGNNAMTTEETGVEVTIPSHKAEGSEILTITCGESRQQFLGQIDTHLERIPDREDFILHGTDRELIFRPHYKQHDTRYGIYWYLLE